MFLLINTFYTVNPLLSIHIRKFLAHNIVDHLNQTSGCYRNNRGVWRLKKSRAVLNTMACVSIFFFLVVGVLIANAVHNMLAAA